MAPVNTRELADGQRLRLNGGEIAAKVFDDEVVLLNLSSGVYYTLERGSFLWQRIVDGYTVSEIVDAVTRRFDVSTERARTDTLELVGRLLDEGVISPVDGEPAVARAATEDEAKRQLYVKPHLQVYRDMEELLALDPPLPSFVDAPWKQS